MTCQADLLATFCAPNINGRVLRCCLARCLHAQRRTDGGFESQWMTPPEAIDWSIHPHPCSLGQPCRHTLCAAPAGGTTLCATPCTILGPQLHSRLRSLPAGRLETHAHCAAVYKQPWAEGTRNAAHITEGNGQAAKRWHARPHGKQGLRGAQHWRYKNRRRSHRHTESHLNAFIIALAYANPTPENERQWRHTCCVRGHGHGWCVKAEDDVMTGAYCPFIPFPHSPRYSLY